MIDKKVCYPVLCNNEPPIVIEKLPKMEYEKSSR